MARIRTVKPELFRHEELFSAEEETRLPLRLAFIGLFCVCDREGRFRWRPRILKLDVLPFDEIDFSRVLDALTTRGFVRKYQVDGQEYGLIPSFTRHQAINNRESESELPAPVENQDKEREKPLESSNAVDIDGNDSREIDASSTRHNLAEGEKEGKGREKEEEEEGKGISSSSQSSLDDDVAEKSKSETVQVKEIFDFWKEVMNAPKALLDDKRKKAIAKALKNYTPDELKAAITGCSLTEFNMGSNKEGRKHNGIELILRDAAHIEEFLATAKANEAQGNENPYAGFKVFS